jgi:hypothetical protein
MGEISKTIALHGGSHIIDAPVSSGTGFLGGHAEGRWEGGGFIEGIGDDTDRHNGRQNDHRSRAKGRLHLHYSWKIGGAVHAIQLCLPLFLKSVYNDCLS